MYVNPGSGLLAVQIAGVVVVRIVYRFRLALMALFRRKNKADLSPGQ